MIIQTLINSGLTPEQAQIYLSLLDNGSQTASSLAKTTDVKRTYIYKICQELEKQHLIFTTTKGKVTSFCPLSPNILINNLQEKKIQTESAQISLDHLLPTLLSKYNLIDTKPDISYYEGVSGINKVYSEIIKTQKDIFLFRPKKTKEYKKYKEIIKKYVKIQSKHNIHAYVISPSSPASIKNFLYTDKKNLTQRHLTQNKNFIFPCQIMLFGDFTSFISFDNPIMTTLIKNKKITQTFKQIFNLLWDLTQTEHNQIIKNHQP